MVIFTSYKIKIQNPLAWKGGTRLVDKNKITNSSLQPNKPNGGSVMKVLNVLLTSLILMFISVQAQAQTTINRSEIPIATHFYMPIGDRNSDIQNDLRWDVRSGTNYYTQLFPGDYFDPNGGSHSGWYVYTDFNTNVNYDNSSYTNNDYHPAEDWNGEGGGNTDLGQPVYASAVGRVIYRQDVTTANTFGRMIQIVHYLPNGDYPISMYAHMDQIMVNEGDLVYPTTQIGTVGNTGTGAAHLHWEIRQQTFLTITATTVSLKNEGAPYTANLNPTAWPGQNTTFITNNYYDPTGFIKQNDLVGKYSPNTWNTNGTSQAILDRFLQAKEAGNPLGSPNNNGPFGYFTHTQDGVTLQDFYGTNTGFDHDYTAIILNPNGTQAHLLKEGFWSHYMNHDGIRNLGAPTSE